MAKEEKIKHLEGQLTEYESGGMGIMLEITTTPSTDIQTGSSEIKKMAW